MKEINPSTHDDKKYRELHKIEFKKMQLQVHNSILDEYHPHLILEFMKIDISSILHKYTKRNEMMLLKSTVDAQYFQNLVHSIIPFLP